MKLQILTSDKMLVSIALAVYNGEKYLPQLLESLTKQSYTNVELIVLNDASTDNSEEIIKNFKPNFSVKYYSNNHNIGVVPTFKKLLSFCNSEYVAFCDQDDIWHPNKIELSISTILEQKNLKIPIAVFSDLTMMNVDGKIIDKSFLKHHKIYPNSTSFKNILSNNIVTGCSLLINNEMKRELLLMPEKVLMHDYWVALIAYSFGKYIFIDEPLVLYRQHQQSVTNKLKRNKLKMVLYLISKYKKDVRVKILQADAFYKHYYHKLDNANQEILINFINKKNRTMFYKALFKNT